MRILVFALMLVSAVALADRLPARQEVQQWQLKNGLKVLFLADHKAPVVTVQVFYHVGSKDEPADKRGMAHLFEHMMFKGSKHVPPEGHARFINSVGGANNAYHDTVPPAALEFTMQLEAERMRNLLLTPKMIGSEREVVKEELRMKLENDPVTQAFEKLLRLAYTVHPYQQLVIGQKQMLDSVTVADCRKFYDTYYRPNNATLIVVGDTDEATVRRLAEKHFGPLERGAEIPRVHVTEPTQTAMREAILKVPVRLPMVVGGYKIPAGASDDMYALRVAQQILSHGESSRLYQRLVRQDKSAVFAVGFLLPNEDPGLFISLAGYLPTGDPARVKAALIEEIDRVRTAPVSAPELKKAKSQLAAEAVYQRERISHMAREMGDDGIVAHDPLRGFKASARYDAVTAAEVLRVARMYLTKEKLTIVVLQPGAQEKKGAHR
jgi:zinc protease